MSDRDSQNYYRARAIAVRELAASARNAADRAAPIKMAEGAAGTAAALHAASLR